MTARVLGHSYVPRHTGNPARVVVDVSHLDTDSYSRSVDRIAMSWARNGGCRNYPGAWSLVTAEYSAYYLPDDSAGNGRPYCVSRISFEVR